MGSSLWFVHQVMFADATNITDRALGANFYSIDSKAMRKVESGQDIVWVIENPVAAGWTLKSGGRILIKLN